MLALKTPQAYIWHEENPWRPWLLSNSVHTAVSSWTIPCSKHILNLSLWQMHTGTLLFVLSPLKKPWVSIWLISFAQLYIQIKTRHFHLITSQRRDPPSSKKKTPCISPPPSPSNTYTSTCMVPNGGCPSPWLLHCTSATPTYETILGWRSKKMGV